MSLIRWDPFGEVGTLFDRLMSNPFVRFPQFPQYTLEGNGSKKFAWAPTADISETEKEYLIRAELPAVRKEDVHVTFDDGVITIKGERRQEKEDKYEKFHRVESFYGSFERSFTVPENVKPEAIRCESKDGMLSVHIPKTETLRQKAKQIAVQ